MRIATWNLNRPRSAGVRTAALLQRMAAVDADVWVLTETRLSLAPADGYSLLAHSAAAPDRGDDECWATVWARSSLAGGQLPSADAERTACAKVRLPKGRVIIVYGTVLPWLSDRRRLPLTGSAAFLGALDTQAADWMRHSGEHPHALLCVAGDFNQDLLTTGHYYGSGRGRTALRDALRVNRLTCLTSGDGDPVARIRPGFASIDHICTGGEVGATGLTAWPGMSDSGTQITDHYGVAVNLK